ncbi:MAG: DNRLRE domain-containing protein [Tepidisphaeraceae bacterium]
MDASGARTRKVSSRLLAKRDSLLQLAVLEALEVRQLFSSADLTPLDDAYVRAGQHANLNFGGDIELVAKTQGSDNTRRAFIKFDLDDHDPSHGGKLRLHGYLADTVSSTVTVSVYPVANTAWTEETITWSNKPQHTNTVLAQQVVSNYGSSTAQWYEFDVAGYLQQEKAAGRDVVSLMLMAEGDNTARVVFNSKEAASNSDHLHLIPPGTTTQNPLADTLVRGGANADTNYGTAATLTVKEDSNADFDRLSYLKFDLSTAGAIGAAKVRVYGNMPSGTVPVTVGLFPASGTSWGEGTITWNNRPAEGATALATALVGSATEEWYEFDITSYAQQEKAAGRNTITLVLKAISGSNRLEFHSRDVATGRPELVVEPAWADVTVSLTGTGSVNEGSDYALGVSVGGAGAASVASLSFDWGDGSAPSTGVSPTTTSATHKYADGLANRTITVRAYDAAGAQLGVGTHAVRVDDVAPVVAISGDATLWEGAPYVLTLSATDPGDDVVTWQVDWGDGETESATGNLRYLEHFYAAGTTGATITATATDVAGTHTPAPVTFQVVPGKPVGLRAAATGTSSLRLDWHDTSAAEDGFAIERSTDGGETFTQVDTVGPNVVQYEATGLSPNTLYYFRARATKTSSGPSEYSNLAFAWTNSAVQVSGEALATEGVPYTLTLDAGGGSLTGWTVDWGDGTVDNLAGSATAATHTYVDGPVGRVIMATAANGATEYDTQPIAIHVSQAPPVVSISGDGVLVGGQPYVIDLAATNVGEDVITKWYVNWGDGSPLEIVAGTETSVSHLYANSSRAYSINAVAVDRDGSYAAEPHTVDGSGRSCRSAAAAPRR